MFRQDPGRCPICDAPHCGCSPGGADSVIVLGQRDAMTAEPPVLAPPVEPPVPEPFTTSTYDRKKHGPKARR
jgi:hypothetical protein